MLSSLRTQTTSHFTCSVSDCYKSLLLFRCHQSRRGLSFLWEMPRESYDQLAVLSDETLQIGISCFLVESLSCLQF